jgi:hypothetical protein
MPKESVIDRVGLQQVMTNKVFIRIKHILL